jgi:hypothetical protein
VPENSKYFKSMIEGSQKMRKHQLCGNGMGLR